ncbi:MAG: AAA family ATPase [Victivallales bacterium]|nr:AAA family ATPase [Victivallales bacterium]
MTALKKRIPQSIDYYNELVRGNYYYVDKTLLVKDVIDNGSKVTLYARPRRFGKSMNLSMLDCFFNIDGRGKGLFEGTAILREGEPYISEMGKYPVIKLSLKEMKCPDYAGATLSFREIIREAWGEHQYLRNASILTTEDCQLFEDIMMNRKSPEELASSIRELTRLLKQYHGAPTVLLIDEYDVPLEAGHTGGYYQQALNLIRRMMSSSCKDNPYLRLSVHTGCLRIARESLYTGFNNPTINTILSSKASDLFGFTEEEVQTLLDFYGIGHLMPVVRKWYDGYRFGNSEIYNPWSVLHFAFEALDEQEYAAKPYWMNTSGNDLLVDLIRTTVEGGGSRNDIEQLLEGGTVARTVNENINYDSLRQEPDAIWNMLLFTGYLKPMEKPDITRNDNRVPLKLANLEVATILRQKVKVWYGQLYQSGQQTPFVVALEDGRAEDAEILLNRLLTLTVSYHDREENFYHGFVAGLLAGAKGHKCLSNRESGDGRADIQLLADDYSAAVVVEVKNAKAATEEALQSTAEEALRQAIARNYDRELRLLGYKKVNTYGIACFAKRCRILKRNGEA